MIIHLSDAAVSDLQSISAYTIKHWGNTQEEIYLSGIWDTLNEISEDSGKFRTRNDLFEKCQIAPIKEHLILFRIEDSQVEIARILQHQMDLKKHI